jgi:hypothetical protein
MDSRAHSSTVGRALSLSLSLAHSLTLSARDPLVDLSARSRKRRPVMRAPSGVDSTGRLCLSRRSPAMRASVKEAAGHADERRAPGKQPRCANAPRLSTVRMTDRSTRAGRPPVVDHHAVMYSGCALAVANNQCTARTALHAMAQPMLARTAKSSPWTVRAGCPWPQTQGSVADRLTGFTPRLATGFGATDSPEKGQFTLAPSIPADSGPSWVIRARQHTNLKCESGCTRQRQGPCVALGGAVRWAWETLEAAETLDSAERTAIWSLQGWHSMPIGIQARGGRIEKMPGREDRSGEASENSPALVWSSVRWRHPRYKFKTERCPRRDGALSTSRRSTRTIFACASLAPRVASRFTTLVRLNLLESFLHTCVRRGAHCA